MKIILLNGPPGSGKDEAAMLLWKRGYAIREKFAAPLFKIVKEIGQLSEKDVQTLTAIGAQELKDMKLDQLGGMSWRQAAIWMSEEVLKPKFGKSIFGKMAVDRLIRMAKSMDTCVVFSDSGFEDEAMELINMFGANNCYLWRIHRPGHTFKDDSRNYIFMENTPAHLNVDDIRNEFELDMFHLQIERRAKKVLGIAP